MERSRKILCKIASTSREVVAVANSYADREDYNCVSRCHFQLEGNMQRISMACERLADILNKPSLKEGHAVDVRIQDWVVTEEPQVCLDILNRMKSLVQHKENTSSWMSRMFRGGRGSTTAGTQDKIKEAVDLFNSCKGCFHFLFSTEIWNNESAFQSHRHAPQSRDHSVKRESVLLESRSPIVTQLDDTVVPLDPGVQSGHAEQGGSNIVFQGLSTDLTTTLQETVNEQGRHEVARRGHEFKSDKQRKEEEKKLEEMLKWLDGLSCAEKHDVTLSLRQDDTCKWLFDTTQYKTWRDGESRSFWLRGKPGAGKSVLTSSVIDSFKNDPNRRKGEILTFFYCDFRNERSTNSAEVIRSILSQLLRHLRGHSANLDNVLSDFTKAKEWGGGTLSNAKELAGITSRAASLLDQKPLVIVDALDECKDVRELIQALMMIRDDVRLFVSSRPLHTIMDMLSDLPFVSMEDMADKLSADIELHVTRELDARQRLRDLDLGFKTEIRSVLCEKADGMFRWVQCSIDTLDRCVTRREVRSALENLPNGLDETYERILRAIDMETQLGRLAQRALVWLVAARRNLRLTEVVEALSINLKTRTLDPDIGPMHHGALLDACGSLVTYSEKTGIIILAHFSVKEYLAGEFICTELPAYYISSEQAHLLLAQSCMCYLSICLRDAQGPADGSSCRTTGASSQSMVRLHPKSKPLLDYALDDALDHFGHLGSTFKSALHDVSVLAEDIQRHSWIWDHVCIPGRWDTWEFRGKPRWPAAVHDLLFYILVAFASGSFMEGFLRRVILKPKKGTNPLVYAAYFDKVEHARMLLSLGARLNQRGWETVGYRQSLPIEVAFRNQHYAMVTLFVEEGSTVPSHIFTDSFFQRTFPSSIVKLLLQTDEFAETINNMTTMHAFKTWKDLEVFRNVAEQDLIAIIKRFTQVADEDFAPNSIKEAFFRLAVAQGYFSAVRYLLTLGTSLPSDLLVTLHRLAGRWKTRSMIQLLVDNGADVLVYTSSRNTVLHAVLRADDVDASEDDILEAIKLLVNLGCNPLKANFHGDTPLQIAIERGYIEVVKLLVDLGCNPLEANSYGRTPLRIAIECGHTSVAQYLFTFGEPLPSDLFVTLDCFQLDWCTPSMVHFLVENGVDPLIHTPGGDSLLHIVLQSLHDDGKALEVVKVLVDYHCDPLEANSRGTTPLHIAVNQGYISVAQHLVTIGAYLPPDLPTTLSPYHWKTAPMIQFLIENHVNVLARTSDGDLMLHAMLYSDLTGHEALVIVKLLISCGCDPLTANPRGKTLLHIAVERNFISVTQYLLTFHSDIALRHKLRIRPRMIRLLVENGVDVLAHSSNWPDPLLHTTLRSVFSDDEALGAVKLLVGYGYDPLEANPLEDTLLCAVVEHGYDSVARYLLSIGIRPRPDLLITLNHISWFGCKARMMIPLLVENGVSVLVRNSDGETLLHIILSAMYHDNEALEAARVLIDYGCDPLEVNTHGRAPLHIAIEQGHTSVARYLISLGASLPPDSLTTLNHPRWSRIATHMIPFLVENGVDVLAHTRGGDSALHVVVQSSDDNDETLEAMRVLVDHGCDPCEADARGKTPLSIAVERCHMSAARFLISIGASPPPDLLITLNYRRWSQNITPMVHFLVENGVNVLAYDSNGNSALHIMLQSLYCSPHGALDAVKVLVAYGCNPLGANAHGTTPLSIAVKQSQISVAQYLVSLGASLPPDLLVTLSRDQSHWSTTPMVRFLVENGVDVLAHADDGDSLLHVALRCINDSDSILEVAKLLVSLGCDPLGANSRGNTPLHVAVQHNHISAVRYFLSLGAPLPPNLLVTLDRARSRWSTIPMIYFLVENGVDVLAHANDGDSVLHSALRCLDWDGTILEVATLLVSLGCDPLEANSRGETPLHIAAERGHVSFARYLITQGASVLTKASNGDTVLHFATKGVYPYPYTDKSADNHTLEAVKFFVERDSDPAVPNDNGETPLHNAVDLGRIKTIGYLLSLNNPLPLDILFTAVQSDQNSVCCRYIVQTLVTSGCDTQTPNAEGDTPLQVAIKKGKVDVVKYLLSVGSVQKPPLEDLLSAAALAPAPVQSEMRRMLSDRRARSESPELPPAKRVKHS